MLITAAIEMLAVLPLLSGIIYAVALLLVSGKARDLAGRRGLRWPTQFASVLATLPDAGRWDGAKRQPKPRCGRAGRSRPGRGGQASPNADPFPDAGLGVDSQPRCYCLRIVLWRCGLCPLALCGLLQGRQPDIT